MQNAQLSSWLFLVRVTDGEFPRSWDVGPDVEVDKETSDDAHVDDPDDIEGLRNVTVVVVE